MRWGRGFEIGGAEAASDRPPRWKRSQARPEIRSTGCWVGAEDGTQFSEHPALLAWRCLWTEGCVGQRKTPSPVLPMEPDSEFLGRERHRIQPGLLEP